MARGNECGTRAFPQRGRSAGLAAWCASPAKRQELSPYTDNRSLREATLFVRGKLLSRFVIVVRNKRLGSRRAGRVWEGESPCQ
jgi:hypothetical protein